MNLRRSICPIALTCFILVILAGCGPLATPTPTPVPTRTPMPIPTPAASISVEADGSGDYATLAEAVEEAPEGAAILLGPGAFQLVEPLRIRGSRQLIGAGMEETQVVLQTDDPLTPYMAHFLGNGFLVMQDISFRHEGEERFDIFVVDGGQVLFSRCRFTGTGANAALKLAGGTTGVVQSCIAENGTYGILVDEWADPILEGNTCTQNDFGILYRDRAGGIASRNDCSQNDIGIQVGDQAQPTLEGNTCAENQTGIFYWDEAEGIARQNQCAQNRWGISLTGSAQPTLEENVLVGNSFGIMYAGASGGTARDNEIRDNEVGIQIMSGDPELVGNRFSGNEENVVRRR